MAVYAVTGKLGAGKGKGSVHQMREYLRRGRRVATNVDLFLEHLMPSTDLGTVIRVPDKPSAVDLYMIGSGNRFIKFDPIIVHSKDSFAAVAPQPEILEGFDESENGLLVLDELGSWFNTRNFQDKGRAEMLEYVIHMRKYGWDCIFIMQNINQVDKQLRESVLEYVVRFTRLDKLKLPVVSGLLQLVTAGALDGSMPKVHIGVVRLGSSPDAMVADRWVFRGNDLNKAYVTTQVFSDSYPHGTHTLLSAWHLSAMASKTFTRAVLPKPLSPHMTKFLTVAILFGALLGAVGVKFWPAALTPPSLVVASAEPVFSKTVTGVGLINMDTGVRVVLSDGRVVLPIRFRTVPGGWEAMVEKDVWVRGRDA